MALVTKNFTLNVTPVAMPPTVHVSEYDIGRTYAVQLLDENGSAYEIPTGTTATVEGTLNGAVGFSTSATISNNQITFALTESMTAYAGYAWCKIKLTLNDEPIQTCAFILAVDRAGVEAETVIGAPGFEEQIQNAVEDWLEENKSTIGVSDALKSAIMEVANSIGSWTVDDAHDLIETLYNALYPPSNVVSVSATFTQGSAVIYAGSNLSVLKPYLVVKAKFTDNTERVVTTYTLSGELVEGTSTITVSCGGKSDTFTVNVSRAALPDEYQEVEWIESDGNQLIGTGVSISADSEYPMYEIEAEIAIPTSNQSAAVLMAGSSEPGYYCANTANGSTVGFTASNNFGNIDITEWHKYTMAWTADGTTLTLDGAQTITRTRTASNNGEFSFFGDYEKLYLAKMRLKKGSLRYNGTQIGNYIPCYRKADNIIGVYNLASKEFIANTGTSSFTKGSDIA